MTPTELFAEHGAWLQTQIDKTASIDPEPEDCSQHLWLRFFTLCHDGTIDEAYAEGPLQISPGTWGRFRMYLMRVIVTTYSNWLRTRRRRNRPWKPLRDHHAVVDRDLEERLDALRGLRTAMLTPVAYPDQPLVRLDLPLIDDEFIVDASLI